MLALIMIRCTRLNCCSYTCMQLKVALQVVHTYRTITDANLIEIHKEISEFKCMCANRVLVHANLQQSEITMEEEKKTTCE